MMTVIIVSILLIVWLLGGQSLQAQMICLLCPKKDCVVETLLGWAVKFAPKDNDLLNTINRLFASKEADLALTLLKNRSFLA